MILGPCQASLHPCLLLNTSWPAALDLTAPKIQAVAASVCSLQTSNSRCQSGASSDLVLLQHEGAWGKRCFGSGLWKSHVSCCTRSSKLHEVCCACQPEPPCTRMARRLSPPSCCVLRPHAAPWTKVLASCPASVTTQIGVWQGRGCKYRHLSSMSLLLL